MCETSAFEAKPQVCRGQGNVKFCGKRRGVFWGIDICSPQKQISLNKERSFESSGEILLSFQMTSINEEGFHSWCALTNGGSPTSRTACCLLANHEQIRLNHELLVLQCRMMSLTDSCACNYYLFLLLNCGTFPLIGSPTMDDRMERLPPCAFASCNG